MKFLIDNALSPEVAAALTAAGHDAIHVRDRNLQQAEDEAIFDVAAAEERTLVSADTDFGTILMLRGQRLPSVVLFRHGSPRRPKDQAEMLLVNLPNFESDLEAGAIIVFRHNRVRIRRLS